MCLAGGSWAPLIGITLTARRLIRHGPLIGLERHGAGAACFACNAIDRRPAAMRAWIDTMQSPGSDLPRPSGISLCLGLLPCTTGYSRGIFAGLRPGIGFSVPLHLTPADCYRQGPMHVPVPATLARGDSLCGPPGPDNAVLAPGKRLEFHPADTAGDVTGSSPRTTPNRTSRNRPPVRGRGGALAKFLVKLVFTKFSAVGSKFKLGGLDPKFWD